MDRKFLTLFASALLAMTANAQTPASAQAGAQADVNAGNAHASGNASSSVAAHGNESSAAIADGTAINASLSAPLDSKKAKEGDEITAKTTESVKAQGKTVLPKGTKLVGHVTRATARGKGDAESALGIAFDKAILKNGQELQLSGSIQALASAETAASAAGTELDGIADTGVTGGGRAVSSGRGALGGVAATAGSTAGTVTNTAGAATSTATGAVNATSRTTTGVASTANGTVGGVSANGQFASNSRGVFGLNGLSLNTVGSNGTEGSVITSAGKNVRLDSGTRMLIVIGSQNSENRSGAPNSQTKPPKPAAHSDSPKSEN
jgi:hypothetical protein